MKTIWRIISGLILSGALLLPSARADTGYGNSPVFAVDLRGLLRAAVTGRVVANGTPVANAAVRVDGTGYTMTTPGDGTFSISNVPVGNGYVLVVSAVGYNTRRLTGINVTASANSLGDITLISGGGPYRLVPMVPDVNPGISSVENSGTAYRYYRALNPAGSSQGGVVVSVQVAGGSAISQTSDVSSNWPGQTAGISDADGIVRISLPASAIGTAGTVKTVQLSVAGQVQQTFQAQVLPSQYEQVWKQKLGYGGSVGVGVLNVEADISPESTICHTIVGGATTSESISRMNTKGLQVGPSVGVDAGLSLKTTTIGLSAGGGVSAGAQVTGAVVARSTFSFDPNSTDPGQNAMKLYVDLGNIICNTPGPQLVFYNFVKQTLEPSFLGSRLSSVEGEVQAGAGVQGQVGVTVAGGSQINVNIAANGSLDAEKIAGYEQILGPNSESASINGVSFNSSASANWTEQNGSSGFAFGTSPIAANGEALTKNWTKQGQSSPYRSEKIQKLSFDAGQQISVPAWQQYDPQALYTNYQRDFTETWEQTNGNPLATYAWSVCAAQQNFGFNARLDLLAFGVNLQGEFDQAAEEINQRGAIMQTRHWPTESYPAITSSQLPSQSWLSMLSQWGYNATGPIGQAVNQVFTAVGNAGNTVIQAGQAQLNILEGGFSQGTQVVSAWANTLTSHLPLVVSKGGIHPMGSSGGTSAYFPQDGQSNYVYGIGGIYHFGSTNSLIGTATLSISYGSADVTGLDPTTFQIYQLPDGTNRWQLVGGTVNMVSNTVTATITNLGTYAVAPPLPTGTLQLQLSTNRLPADGVSQMTVTVTNLVLNTGNSATQSWLFTATASGATILDANADPNVAGVQIVSTNASITLHLLAPTGGNHASVSLSSVAGDAVGQVSFDLVDTTSPSTPAGVSVIPGQSRIWVAWQTNSEPDLGSYRVYYRLGQSGPPWDGAAAIEGSPSPVIVNSTNCLLRGLQAGTNYYVAVSALDTTGNESPLSAAVSVTTTQSLPAQPTAVAARFGNDGTNLLMWALSEDDGYNDRDVMRYDILRAVLPGGTYTNVGSVAAGIGIYSETNPVVAPPQYVSYAVVAVASNSLTSAQTPANRLMADGTTIDNDGDGIPDWWMVQYFGHPTGLASDQSLAQNDPANDGLSNLQKYLAGLNPLVWDNLHFSGYASQPDCQFQLGIFGQTGTNYTLLASTDLVNWIPILNFTCTNTPMNVVDPGAKYYGWRFYRIAQGTIPVTLKLGLNAPSPFSTNGLGFNFQAPLGFSYVIQSSTDLVSWQPFTNFIGTNSVMFFRDRDSANYPRRFYRAVMP
jgi:hypothetical protein